MLRVSGNVGVGRGADHALVHAQIPELGRAEGLDDLRTRGRGGAAIEDPLRRQVADRIGPMRPPRRAVACGVVEPRGVVGKAETHVQGEPAARDRRPRRVVDLAPGFVLVEAEVEIRTQEVA
jgi:hypothetical protein